MTFYKGLPLIGKDTPTIEPTGTNVHENTLLFLRGSEFPGQSLTSAPHWSFIFHWPLYLLSNLHQLSGTIVENVSCSSINLNCICICFWCSSNGHCRGLFCGQLMQLGPCMGYKSGHHSLQCMLF
ncbi:unnamed protein product [Sphagnum jensenii]|uniref:Uncharacterized protein n=1 Tax=Sphagnum jensenii TaxID=128206 RepID=A0ABP0WP51_9BRYO